MDQIVIERSKEAPEWAKAPLFRLFGRRIGPWDTEEYELHPGTTILARRSDTGACVYLDPQTGCTIYESRPKACRAFSCEIFVENADGVQTEALAAEHPQFRRVIREGRRRCGPLTPL